ncbi:MAG: ADYC domain-containing protein [Kofleriaceae bacterium]
MRALALMMLVGCAVEPVTDSETDDLKLGGSACSDWMCGTNSPVMDGLGFHHLYTLPYGKPEEHGFGITAMQLSNGHQATLRVIDGKMQATDLTSPYPVIKNSGLESSHITLHNYATNTDYDLEIEKVSNAGYWAKPLNGTHPNLEAYQILWKHSAIRESYQYLCPNTITASDGMGLYTYLAVVYEGDFLDAVNKVDRYVDTGQFNLGCAGSTVSKLALTGHTLAAIQDGFSTTIDERTTMIKMLSADYCGNGTPFTVAGEPLYWADDKGTMNPLGSGVTEAMWTKDGAACLDTPRIEAHPALPSKFLKVDDTLDLLDSMCKPPPCTHKGYHLTSINPT